MANCAECVHVSVCRYYTNELAKANGIPLKLEEVERLLECDDCENFKDRSRFVELPCKAGDRVYAAYPKAKVAVEYVIVSIWVEEAGVSVRAVDTAFFTYGFFMAHDFDKKLFFTKEDAEQALKERENNEK